MMTYILGEFLRGVNGRGGSLGLELARLGCSSDRQGQKWLLVPWSGGYKTELFTCRASGERAGAVAGGGNSAKSCRSKGREGVARATAAGLARASGAGARRMEFAGQVSCGRP
mmetsp:Transcript_6982/g.21255  ORF Transcript_6982/g.21255 Transcript_6982/m.21255 type:complete len:113 (+) Transcript_6982:423-761(+)